MLRCVVEGGGMRCRALLQFYQIWSNNNDDVVSLRARPSILLAHLGVDSVASGAALHPVQSRPPSIGTCTSCYQTLPCT